MSGRALPVIGSTDPWFGGPVTSAATCVLAPNPSPWTLDGTNTWILGLADEAVVIIDPGPDDDVHRAAIAEALGDRRVASIVLTHGHLDHSEGARTLAAIHRVGVKAVDPHHRLGSEGLVPGEVIDVAGGCEIILTPGHTSDSASLLLHADRSLITGDTVLGRGTALVAWPDGRLGDYLLSLRRLAESIADVTMLLPGHGPALDLPSEVIENYLEHRLQRLDEVRECLATGVAAPADIVAVIYADVPREVWPAAELTVRAQLDYLNEGY